MRFSAAQQHWVSLAKLIFIFYAFNSDLTKISETLAADLRKDTQIALNVIILRL